MYSPLADRIRPKNLEDFCGQEHLVGVNKPLNKIIKAKQIPNMIFYGPSGIGKTTFANILATETDRKLYKLNATTSTIADIKQITDELDSFFTPNGVLLYLDEIQYFNKKQQQTLLEFMENGKITLIASTTENPYFYIYNAILSRATVFEFLPLTPSDVKKALVRAFNIRESESGYKISIDDKTLDIICFGCGGDVRKAINAAELLTLSINSDITITEEAAKGVSQRSSVRYDRDGDVHYDLLSAFQKSIRGSDENAALHYLARLIEAGDLPSVCRRLLVIACEDIGLAYPNAIAIVKSCVDACLQLGLPEGRIPLANAVVLLATSPKSNTAYVAVDKALEDIKNGKTGEVPNHLKDTHYSGATKLGRGGYVYPHGKPNNYVLQEYLPKELEGTIYYEYGQNKNEQLTKRYWDEIKGKSE